MTVVLEDQVKTIAAEIAAQYGDGIVTYSPYSVGPSWKFADDIDVEEVVRAVIAQYDISTITRMQATDIIAAAAAGKWPGL